MAELVKPSLAYLDSYCAALKRGWSPDNIRLAAVAQEELQKIEQNAQGFLLELDQLDAPDGAIVTLADGSKVPRLPGFRRWIWDGEFCGSIGFRFQTGTSALPPQCLGHIGYSIVPWKQNMGYATKALSSLLEEIKPFGLDYVELTTEPDNIPSQRVITKNGGTLIETFKCHPAYGDCIKQRYRIYLVP